VSVVAIPDVPLYVRAGADRLVVDIGEGTEVSLQPHQAIKLEPGQHEFQVIDNSPRIPPDIIITGISADEVPADVLEEPAEGEQVVIGVRATERLKLDNFGDLFRQAEAMNRALLLQIVSDDDGDDER
jgi:hypothetical protein